MREGWRTNKPPEEEEYYLIQLNSGDMMVCCWNGLDYRGREGGTWSWKQLPQYTRQDDVVAWRPLPEPYDTRSKARHVKYVGEDEAKCPQCGYRLSELPGYKNLKLFEEEYCPYCGARMLTEDDLDDSESEE